MASGDVTLNSDDIDETIAMNPDPTANTNSTVSNDDSSSFCQKFATVLQGITHLKNSKSLSKVLCELQSSMVKQSERIAELEAQNLVLQQWRESCVPSSSPVANLSYAAAAKRSAKTALAIPVPVRIAPILPTESSAATKGLLKNEVASTGICVKGVKEVGNGNISVLCSTQSDANALKEKISNSTTIKVVDLPKSPPAFSFCVPDKIETTDDAALVAVLRNKNSNVFSPAPEDGTDDPLKVVHKHSAKNGKGTVVIIRISPRDYDALKRAKRIFLSWECVSIREMPATKQCRNCLRFGHKAEVCRFKIEGAKAKRCPSCPANHDDCKLENPTCTNCLTANNVASNKKWSNWKVLDTNHRADSKQCPSFKKALEEARLFVDYGHD